MGINTVTLTTADLPMILHMIASKLAVITDAERALSHGVTQRDWHARKKVMLLHSFGNKQ